MITRLQQNIDICPNPLVLPMDSELRCLRSGCVCHSSAHLTSSRDSRQIQSKSKLTGTQKHASESFCEKTPLNRKNHAKMKPQKAPSLLHGTSWGHLGVHLGKPSAPLGAFASFWGHLGSILDPIQTLKKLHIRLLMHLGLSWHPQEARTRRSRLRN